MVISVPGVSFRTRDHPHIDAAIIGPRTVAHLDAMLAATIGLSAEDSLRLSAVFEDPKN